MTTVNKRNCLTIAKKQEILRQVGFGKSYKQLSEEYGVDRSTIGKIVKNKRVIEEIVAVTYVSTNYHFC